MTTPAYDPAELLGHRANLKIALAQIAAKREVIDTAWAYYEGDHPVLWMTEKLQDIFRGMNNRVHDNLCEVAVDAVLSRLAVTGWESSDEATQDGDVAEGDEVNAAVEAATIAWEANGLDLEQEDLYRHAQVSGVGYVLVWPNEAGKPEAVVQDPRTIHVEYGSLRGGDRKWAAKVWHDTDAGTWRANLYYRGETLGAPGRLVRLMIPGRSAITTPPDARRFTFDPDDPGGMNVLPDSYNVPVVPFERRRGARSRLYNLVPVQDKINKLAANKMVAAEFAAFRQRVFITTQSLEDGALRNAPDRAIVLDPGTPDAPTSIHEFAVTELSNYDNAIDKEIGKFCTIAGIPRHILIGSPGGAGGTSGEFIKADEGPFVAYVESLAKRFSAAWTDVMMLLGIPVRPVWEDPNTHNDEAVARTVKTFTDAGVPVAPVLVRYAGWSQDDADEAEARVTAGAQQAAAAGALALAAFDQGAAPENALPGV